jgi:nucleoside-diphosphate kinase
MTIRFLLCLFITSAAQIGLFSATQTEVLLEKTPTIERPTTEKIERTLSIIKPDAVKNDHIGDVISRFEKSGLHIAGIKMIKLNKEQAGAFYQEHKDRPFYTKLVEFMTSGPVVILVLEGNNAVATNRRLMGATDPSKADPGTIRADFAESVTNNAVHGSDSPESANREIFFFFQQNELTAH